MGTFFDLPTDLQVHILHSWINNIKDSGRTMLKALSALNVAACGKACRADCRFLLSQVPAFGEYTLNGYSYPISAITQFLKWLGRRQVAMRCVVLTRDKDTCTKKKLRKSKYHFPHVESIVFAYHEPYLTVELLEAVLRVCPNVTYLELDRCLPLSPAVAALVPKLKHIYCPNADRLSTDTEMVSMLTSFGPQLQELGINCALSDSVLQLLHQTDSQLQKLAFTTSHVSFHGCVELLLSCKHLSDLELLCDFWCALEPTVIEQIAIATPRLKRLCLTSNMVGLRTACELLSSIRELRPDMEVVEIGGWRYDAVDSILQLNVRVLMGACSMIPMVTRLLNGCPSVKDLRLFGYKANGVLAETIVQHQHMQGGCLQSLVVSADDSLPIELLLQAFGKALRSLELYGKGITGNVLGLIAAHCKLLESISLSYGDDSASDDRWNRWHPPGLLIAEECEVVQHVHHGCGVGSHHQRQTALEEAHSCFRPPLGPHQPEVVSATNQGTSTAAHAGGED